MRFTRPGARPRQRTLGLEATQLRGGVLGARIEDERAGSQLGAGQVLQLVAGSIRRVELDVEVVLPATAAWWLLVHRHHVRQRAAEEPVVFLEQALQDGGEGKV